MRFADSHPRCPPILSPSSSASSRVRSGHGGQRPVAGVGGSGKRPSRQARPGDWCFLAGFFQPLLRYRFPGDKFDLIAIPDSHPAPWKISARLPSVRPLCSSTKGKRHGRSWNGWRTWFPERPHVVWRFGNHDVVERTVAERSLCHVHGDARGRRLETRVAALGQFHRVRAAAMQVDGLNSTRPIGFQSRTEGAAGCSTC